MLKKETGGQKNAVWSERDHARREASENNLPAALT